MRKRLSGRATPYQLIMTPPKSPPLFWRSFWVSALLALSLLALLYLLHQLVALPFQPADFFVWLTNRLPGLVRTIGFVVTTSASIAFDVLIGDALLTVGAVALLLCFVGSGGLIGALAWRLGRARGDKRGWGVGAIGGLLWGIGLSGTSISVNGGALTVDGSMLGRYGIVLVLFTLWGVTTGWANARLLPFATPSKRSAQLEPARRRFLLQLATGALTLALVSGAAGLQLGRWRNQQRRAIANDPFATPAFFPATLWARIYPTTDATGAPLSDFQFPEFAHPRYHPETHPLGVAFSGGGPLSASAAMGQMRGLAALGLLDQIGAISAVSGGAWFATLFSYAPASIADGTLVGDIIEPAAITVTNLAELDPHNSAAAFTTFSTESIGAYKTGAMVDIGRQPNPPFNRLYSRTLNAFLLKPFDLADPHRFFTLDQVAVAQIMARNPALQPNDFYTMRANRPYLIAGIAQDYLVADKQRLRAVEVTPLYTGMHQYFPGEGVQGLDIGGGYVESFAFDSTAPLSPVMASDAERWVEVQTPSPPFLLSDLLGSTSSAPGALLNAFGQPEWFPQFNYWSPRQQPTTAPGDGSASYSFVDGAVLESSGIIPLLRRQYPLIIAFINVDSAIGVETGFTAGGLNQTITRLFGFNPTGPFNVAQDVQVFPSAQFQPLVDGLTRAKAEGRAPWFVDSYELLHPNPFNLAPYPDSGATPGKVTVVWVYNDRNQGWYQQLTPEVQALFTQDDPTNDLRNFPNYHIFLQNKNRAGLPQLLNLTATQINLLAHMHCYTVMHDAGETLLGLLAALSNGSSDMVK